MPAVTPDADAPAVTPDADAPAVPKGGASLAAWREYAATLGASDADLDGKTRDELREQYGPKE
jgi:hypothetical protein